MNKYPKEVATHIYDNLFRAFGGSSQFGTKTMFDALQGHIRNGLMSPNTTNHNKIFAKEVWNELVSEYFSVDCVELDDETKELYNKALTDGHDLIEVFTGLR